MATLSHEHPPLHVLTFWQKLWQKRLGVTDAFSLVPTGMSGI